MPRSSHKKARRRRVGRVSYYLHHGAWWVYYREGERQVRRRVGQDEREAEQVASQINAQLATAAPTMFSFTPISVAELRREFLDHHEHVRGSSLASIQRYRTATRHLEAFVQSLPHPIAAHEAPADQFVRYLRVIEIAPNGHPHTDVRPLHDKGIRYILETCRSLYAFAARRRHLPPYTENPFSGLAKSAGKIRGAKPVFVFDHETEPRFLLAADTWAFPIHFTLSKTGLRSGELVHLLVEDLDLQAGWLFVRNKPELGWRIKTGQERRIPLVAESAAVLRRHLAGVRSVES